MRFIYQDLYGYKIDFSVNICIWHIFWWWGQRCSSSLILKFRIAHHIAPEFWWWLYICRQHIQITLRYCKVNTLQWRHNGADDVSNHQPHDCLLNRLFRCRSKKTSKYRVTGLCAGNSLVTSEFPAQMASNAENVSIQWRHHDDIPVLGPPVNTIMLLSTPSEVYIAGRTMSSLPAIARW